jgi:hypothetical protein
VAGRGGIRHALIWTLAAAYAGAASAWAATDGSLGKVSEGSSNVTISLAPLVKISHLKDLTLPTFKGSGNSIASEDLCVYTNVQVGAYRVTAIGSGSGGAFAVTSGKSSQMDYSARWNTRTGTSGNVELTPNVTLAGRSGASTTSESCGGGNNANLEVSIPYATLARSWAGTYTGTLRLVVEPD